MDNNTNLNNVTSNNYLGDSLNPLTRQLTSDLVDYSDTTPSPTITPSGSTFNYYSGDNFVDYTETNRLQFTNQPELSGQRNQHDYCDNVIKETVYPFNLIETFNYQQPIDYIQHHHHHHHHHHQDLSSSTSTQDYRPTVEATINTDYSESYNVSTRSPTNLWSLTNCSTINNNNTIGSSSSSSSPSSSSSSSSPNLSSSMIRSRSYSFSSIPSNHHHANQNNPSTILTQTGLIEPSPSLSTMATIDYANNNSINHSSTNSLTLSSTPELIRINQHQQSTPCKGYYYCRPFGSSSSASSSCSTSTSSLNSSPPTIYHQSSSLVDRGDYLFTIDDGDLSSGSSIASSTSSSSFSSYTTSSRLPRKRSVGDDHDHHHLLHHSTRNYRSKLTKKEKLDKMMSEDKRLESENDILREQIRVMEHQFKVLQTKITNILIDAAKKAS